MAKILGLENRNLEVVVRFRHLSEFSLVSAFLFFFFILTILGPFLWLVLANCSFASVLKSF